MSSLESDESPFRVQPPGLMNACKKARNKKRLATLLNNQVELIIIQDLYSAMESEDTDAF